MCAIPDNLADEIELTYQNCAACTDWTDCLACDNGYLLSDGSCSNNCPAGYYGEILYSNYGRKASSYCLCKIN